MTRILIVDNHDSFVHTLIGYLDELGAQTTMVESDSEDEQSVAHHLRQSDGVLLSPGPGTPDDAGVSLRAVTLAAEQRIPLLGVCLGHQVLGQAFGARISRALEPKHGMVSPVEHTGDGIFQGIPSPLKVGRYHSLAVWDVPDELTVTAWAPDRTVMALKHRDLPLQGVQFHPESVLSQLGHRLLANWLVDCGDPGAPHRANGLSPLR